MRGSLSIAMPALDFQRADSRRSGKISTDAAKWANDAYNIYDVIGSARNCENGHQIARTSPVDRVELAIRELT
jgi:hypothetical protein